MTYQPDTLTEAKFNTLTNAIMNLEAKLNATSASQLLTIANHASANAHLAISQIADLRAEVAELKSLYQDVFNMAARAVADIADAADKEGQ